ncbi:MULTISPECIES: FecCD family ABC transporter permease [Shinella]|uniref:Iron ABC transporter permease n=1 Tax=Shinella sedimenti TaxID=2919913 RepID=A0ABT0CQ41_9HYPH|nr:MULTISPECIES: iron ABC transporter permease [Shinella]MCJ8150730.1 iron ABC transporter permease [Shinella sedimenti]
MSEAFAVAARRVRRREYRLAGLLAGLVALVGLGLLSLAFGSRPIPLGVVLDTINAYNPSDDRHLIVWSLRVPRTAVALLAGLALGASGAVMQAITRNPMAEPGLLGVNAGAAIAVVLGASFFGVATMAGRVWFGIAGAGLAGVVVLLLGRAHETGTNPVRLVLAGAGLSVMLGAVTGIVLINAPTAVLDDFRTWAAGSVAGRGFDVAGVLAIVTTIGLVLAFSIAANLNAISLGSDLGKVLGLHTGRTLFLACLAVMLLAGGSTAAAGPVGFVGLVAPHLARAVTGPDYRWILPYSALFAALLLLGADLLGRMIASPDEIATGIVTALVGGPFFIFIVRRFRLRPL